MALTKAGVQACLRLLAGAGARGAPEDVEAMLDAWRATLGELSNDELLAATQAWLKSSPWWPTPADLLRLRPALGPARRPLEAEPGPELHRARRRAAALGAEGREANHAASELLVAVCRAGRFDRFDEASAALAAIDAELDRDAGCSGAEFAARVHACLWSLESRWRLDDQRAEQAARAPRSSCA